MLRSLSLACLVLLAAATLQPRLAFADLCREVEVNDRIVVRCFSCQSPGSFEERAACDEVCRSPEGRRSESSCPLSDEERRRLQPCRDNEVRAPDGTCQEVRCGVDERVENGRCVPGACEPGRVLVNGECVKPRRMVQNDPPLQCIDKPTLDAVQSLIDETEGLAETRKLLGVALAVAKLTPVRLESGRTISIAPDESSDETVKLRRSLEAITKQQGGECTARPDLKFRDCDGALLTLLEAQTDRMAAPDGVGVRLNEAVERGLALPSLGACLAAEDARTLAFQEELERASDVAESVLFINAVIKNTLTSPEVLSIECERPDLATCTVNLEGRPKSDDGRIMLGLVKKYLRKFGTAGAAGEFE